MKVLTNILKLNYSLADWFAGRRDRIVPGATFFFLNQVVFTFGALYFIIIPLLPFKLSLNLAVAILVGTSVLLYYGLEKKIEEKFKILNYEKQYSRLPKKTKVLYRLFGLSLFISTIAFMFVIGILSFEGYGR